MTAIWGLAKRLKGSVLEILYVDVALYNFLKIKILHRFFIGGLLG